VIVEPSWEIASSDLPSQVESAAPGTRGRIVAGDDGWGGGADAVAFSTALSADLGSELIVARVEPGGSVPHELGERARREDAKLIVVGAHGHRHPAGLVRGGVAERLIHESRLPVVVVPAGWGTEPHRLRVIGVAFDGRPESRGALALAARLAERAQATMRVIAVTPPGAARNGMLAVELHAAVEELPSTLRALPVLDQGNVAQRLSEESAKGLDVLVCGSRGHGPFGGVLFGSVSRALIRAADCPVLVVPRASSHRTP